MIQMLKSWPCRSTDHTTYIWWLFHICTVHSTNHLELHCGAHDRHKPIKTEPHPELANDIHGSHEMKSSVIRIPHEYGWVTRRHTHFERNTKCFVSFSVCCSASPLTLYGSGGQRLLLHRIHICSCWDFFFKIQVESKDEAGVSFIVMWFPATNTKTIPFFDTSVQWLSNYRGYCRSHMTFHQIVISFCFVIAGHLQFKSNQWPLLHVHSPSIFFMELLYIYVSVRMS